jgi:glycerol kinase
MNTRPDLMSLSRRNSLAGGPRPITKAEYSGPNTPSLLSRAGSPVMPLGNEQTLSREQSREGGFSLHRKEMRHGEFIGSLDCGTTYVI